MSQQALRKQDAMNFLGYTATSTFYLHIKQGIIPKPLKLGGTRVWLKKELQDVLDNAERSHIGRNENAK